MVMFTDINEENIRSLSGILTNNTLIFHTVLPEFRRMCPFRTKLRILTV